MIYKSKLRAKVKTHEPKSVRMAIHAATTLAAAILEAAGADAANARIVAEHLVESDLRGVRSHGLMRVDQYVVEMTRGEIDGRARPEIASAQGARVLIDGKRGFGQVAGACAVDQAGSVAAAYGVGLAIVHRAGHAGRIGAYVEQAAAAGNVAIGFCSGPRSGHRVAPFGGVDGRLSTNPIAFAFPGDNGPVVADFSTSTVPEGVVRRLRDLGLPAPDGSIQDASGTPSSDPAVLYTDPPGTILPLGGPLFGHKGYALGLLVEAMTTLLAGEDASDPERLGNNLTLCVVAGDEDVVSVGQSLARYVRSSRPANPERPVLLPGDPERSARLGSANVSIDEPTWDALSALTARFGVTMPPIDA
jgi:uncharacterized oxidoreductase